jgi:hypothetical protein
MKVLIACEFSGIVRDAFIARGHDAISCDLLPTEKLGPHYQGNVLDILYFGWDLIIAHPPCTRLTSSGARWFKDYQTEQQQAADFFMRFTSLSCLVCIENPIGIMSTKYRKPDQIIQPWQFGHGETKATCLWLFGLQKLVPTNIVEGREHRIHRMSPGPNRGKDRSRFYSGISDAMADQWG